MILRGPIWHGPLLACLALAPGCYAMHGVPGLEPSEPDAAVRPDAPPARADAPMSSRCDELFAALRAGTDPASIGCDGRTFPRDCSERVGECCTLTLDCAIEPGDGGHVVTNMVCVDLCDLTCGSQPIEDCALYGCERFDPGACGPAPSGVIEGPACIDPRGGPCNADEDCAAGQHCRTYWINPCAGASCDACGGEERRCAR